LRDSKELDVHGIRGMSTLEGTPVQELMKRMDKQMEHQILPEVSMPMTPLIA
jgi:hypothetical protein